MNKVYILAILTIFSLIPTRAEARFCFLFIGNGCGTTDIKYDNSIDGSFNTTVNSNVNSPGGVVSDNNSTIVNTPAYYDNGGGYYDDGSHSNTRSLYVSCDADTSYADTDERVTWSAYASGGNGSYRYDWSGSEGLDGDDDEVTIRYDDRGTKNASVRVTSGGQSITRSCGTVKIEDDRNDDYDYYDGGYYSDNYDYRPSVSCYPETTYTNTGSLIVWRAYATGGNGRYTYSWSGTDSLSGRDDVASRVYSRPGIKSASVVVRSNNRSTTASCGTVTVYNAQATPYIPSYTSGTLSASCSPSVGYATTGKVITWSVYPNGGNGIYTYLWSGTDGFAGAQKSVVTSYRTTGTKYANATVYSQGRSISVSCGSVSISGSTSVKAPVKKPTIVKEIVDTVPKTSATFSNIFSDVPWTLVFLVIILVLFGTIMYLLLGKKG